MKRFRKVGIVIMAITTLALSSVISYATILTLNEDMMFDVSENRWHIISDEFTSPDIDEDLLERIQGMITDGGSHIIAYDKDYVDYWIIGSNPNSNDFVYDDFSEEKLLEMVNEAFSEEELLKVYSSIGDRSSRKLILRSIL